MTNLLFLKNVSKSQAEIRGTVLPKQFKASRAYIIVEPTSTTIIHYNHCFHINHESINSIIIGDSIMAGLMHYNNIWKNLFGSRFINLGIRGDLIEHVLWCVKDKAFSPRLKNNVILCGMNKH